MSWHDVKVCRGGTGYVIGPSCAYRGTVYQPRPTPARFPDGEPITTCT